MEFSTSVKLEELVFEVEGNFTPGEGGDGQSIPPESDELEISKVSAYIPKNNNEEDKSTIVVDGNAILDFADAWPDMEAAIKVNINSGNCKFD